MTFKQKISLITHTCALFGVMTTFKLLLWYVLRPKTHLVGVLDKVGVEQDRFEKLNPFLQYVLRPNIEDSFDKRNRFFTLVLNGYFILLQLYLFF